VRRLRPERFSSPESALHWLPDVRYYYRILAAPTGSPEERLPVGFAKSILVERGARFFSACVIRSCYRVNSPFPAGNLDHCGYRTGTGIVQFQEADIDDQISDDEIGGVKICLDLPPITLRAGQSFIPARTVTSTHLVEMPHELRQVSDDSLRAQARPGWCLGKAIRLTEE
jgi:hypothetical protein